MLLASFFVAITMVILGSFMGNALDGSMFEEVFKVLQSCLFSTQKLKAATINESPEIRATPNWTEHCLTGIRNCDHIIIFFDQFARAARYIAKGMAMLISRRQSLSSVEDNII
jgi:hypothetical protein